MLRRWFVKSFAFIIFAAVMKVFVSIAAALIYAGAVFAGSADTVRVSAAGALPWTYENCVEAIQAAIDSCRPGSVLLFEGGRYDIWPEGAVRKEIYISNTSSEAECPSKEKVIGLHFCGLDSVTVDGAGATLMMHGRITPIAVDSCRNFVMKNITIDFERPGTSELTYTDVAPGRVVMHAHRDTRYDIVGKRINLIGEGWRSNRIHCISFGGRDGHATFSTDWQVLRTCDVEEAAPGELVFSVPEGFAPEAGATLTLRDIIRDRVGALVTGSEDVMFSDVNMRYMHGLGIVSQYSRNITMERVNCRPSAESGRILASSADFMHFSGCSGAVRVVDCKFSGSHDDHINVHGTNLRAEDMIAPDALRLRFMHPQSYGYDAYHAGDTVAFVEPATMLRSGMAVVKSVVRENPRNLIVYFDRRLPDDIRLKATCVENMTCTPTVHVSGCTFERSSTRGILATTPRRVMIENNTFSGLGMAAVLIEGDASGWYESGPVTDVVIRGNRFADCGYNNATHGATIAINPSNTVVSPKAPVHENISIVDNTFDTSGRPVLYAKSTARILFEGNTVAGDGGPVFIFDGCDRVNITGNSMAAPRIESTDCTRIKVRK